MKTLKQLKQEADKLGIKYPKNANEEAMKKLLSDYADMGLNERSPEKSVNKDDELEELKNQADLMGIELPENATKDEIIQAIQEAGEAREKTANGQATDEEKKIAIPDIAMIAPGTDTSGMKLDEAISAYNLNDEKDKIKQAQKLIRVKVMNMNPDTQWKKAEEVHIGNAKYGTIAARVVPFGVEWHVEKCIYDYLVNKTFRYKKEKEIKNENGAKNIVIEYEERPEFAVQVLPPLTPKELKDLADDQRKTERLKDD